MVPLYVVPFEELRPAEEAVMAEVSGKEKLYWRRPIYAVQKKGSLG